MKEMHTGSNGIKYEDATGPIGNSILDTLFGRPLPSDAEYRERIGPAAGIPIFGLDALSSAAYGPEAALTVLLVLGLGGVQYLFSITLAIIALLTIVYFSYRQTIAAYPHGGGSYTVASENLGARVGLVAGAALMIDYILNVAVGISAGVGALVSAVPLLQPHTLGLCLGILLILTIVNLRGVREAGLAFTVPTYLFVGSLGGVIVIGLIKAILHGGHPLPVATIPRPGPAVATVSVWLLVKAFASGCTALTGVEAVSNGVQSFRAPSVKNARTALATIIVILVLLLASIAYLCEAYGIAATPPGQIGYQSVLSQLTAAVTGRQLFYFVTMGAVLVVLALSANTSFADFPRVCRALAENRYLPYPFTIRGRRLVFSHGIYALAICAGLLLIVFGGVTDPLIPLFAIGAFTAFTLSQAGMVMHWKKKGGAGWRSSMVINAVGSLATGLTTCAVIVAKFTEGAWITILAILGLLLFMSAVHHQYDNMLRETDSRAPVQLHGITPPVIVLPMERWSKVAEKALRYAYTFSQEIVVVHVAPEDEDGAQTQSDLMSKWDDYVSRPAIEAGFAPPRLVVLRSPYRLVMTPIFEYILRLEREHCNRIISVVVPELIERRWYYFLLLHNQRANALKIILYLRGDSRTVVTNVPWYLQS
jgi:amino acid transporter